MTFTGLSAAARVAVWSVAALAGLYWAALVSPLGRALDHSAMTALSAAPQEDRWAVSLVDLVSMDLFLTLGGALVLIALAMHGVQRAVVAAVTIGGSALTAEWMKAHVERLDGVPNSFPSGHVMAVAALSAGLFLVAEGLPPQGCPRVRPDRDVLRRDGPRARACDWRRIARARLAPFRLREYAPRPTMK